MEQQTEMEKWFKEHNAPENSCIKLPARDGIAEGCSVNYDWLQENNLWEEFKEKFFADKINNPTFK